MDPVFRKGNNTNWEHHKISDNEKFDPDLIKKERKENGWVSNHRNSPQGYHRWI